MSKVLLDTDIFSEILKNKNPTVVARAANYRQEHGRYTIAALTVTEIDAGYQQAQRLEQLRAFRDALAAAKILPLNRLAADLAGLIMGDLARTGQPLGLVDPLIAALAITNRLTLVTGNTNHFERISALGYPLSLDNWRTTPSTEPA